MITTTYEWRGQRILRVTVIVSLVLHVILALLAFWAVGVATKLFPVPHLTPPKEKDEIVTISSAERVAKKAVPVPVVRPAHPPPRPPQPRSVPVQALIPHPLQQPKAELPLPSRALHELAKQAPRAPANPPQTVREKTITDEPSAPPRTPPPQTPPPEKRVARAENLPPSSPQRASNPSRFSEQQLAQINRDLSRTIAQARSANNPLRVSNQIPASSMKRYRVQMLGAVGPMRNGQGYYYPIRAWRAGGLDFYYVSYEFTYPDGTYETGGVPWPISFPPSQDPFFNPVIGARSDTPLPGPPPGYVPPANLGKALRSYFPGMSFGDATP